MGFGVSFVMENLTLLNDELCDLSESFKMLIKSIGVNLDYNLFDKLLPDDWWGGDVHVFFAPETDEFIMLDLYWGHAQSPMVILGVHVDISRKDEVEKIMRLIHGEIHPALGIKFVTHHKDELKHEIDISQYPRRRDSYMQNIFYHRV